MRIFESESLELKKKTFYRDSFFPVLVCIHDFFMYIGVIYSLILMYFNVDKPISTVQEFVSHLHILELLDNIRRLNHDLSFNPHSCLV